MMAYHTYFIMKVPSLTVWHSMPRPMSDRVMSTCSTYPSYARKRTLESHGVPVVDGILRYKIYIYSSWKTMYQHKHGSWQHGLHKNALLLARKYTYFSALTSILTIFRRCAVGAHTGATNSNNGSATTSLTKKCLVTFGCVWLCPKKTANA